MRDVPSHYIRANETSRVPRRFVVLDTEARRSYRGATQTQRWGLGVAEFIHWTNRGKEHREMRDYMSPDDLWRDVTDFTRSRRRTVVYAHNMPYDMRIGDALHILPALGWELSMVRLASRGSWSKWTRDDATLYLADTASLWPCALATLGKTLGVGKLPLPDHEDTPALLARCRRDVEILSAAVRAYVAWLQTGEAGSWQVTGASQSWAHWRHSHYTHRVVSHQDADVLAAERRGAWCGRAEAWRWGRGPGEYVYEWDWSNAYPRIARDCYVPTRARWQWVDPPMRALDRIGKDWTYVADVEVDTKVPLVPAAYDGGILWPVGVFRTTLWEPEIRLLAECGADIRPGRAYFYRAEPALASWGAWIIDTIHDSSGEVPGWLKIMCKHWSRALIGRFAMRYQDWGELARFPDDDIWIGKTAAAGEAAARDTMRVGKVLWEQTGLTEPDDACPQITGYVQSEARVRLWHATQAAGAGNVLYIDTDSLVVNTAGHMALRAATRAGRFDGLRLKHRYRGWEIYGPRSAVFGGVPKLAGVPHRAVRVGDMEWEGEVWSRLESAGRVGNLDRVTVGQRRFRVGWNERRRARAAGGGTVPRVLPSGSPAASVGRVEAVTEAERTAWWREWTAARGGAGYVA